MRPDRLLIGEVREAEALDLLIAMNSGLPGRRSNLPSAFLVLPHTAQRIAAYTPTEPSMPLGGAIVARTTARATGELALTKRTGRSSWANVAERGRGQAGRFGRGDAPGESGPQGPPATTHTGTPPAPQPRRPPPGTWRHDRRNPAPLHPPSMTATEPAHAPLPGLPTPYPGENRLHPLPAEPHRRDTATVSRALARPYPAAWARI